MLGENENNRLASLMKAIGSLIEKDVNSPIRLSPLLYNIPIIFILFLIIIAIISEIILPCPLVDLSCISRTSARRAHDATHHANFGSGHKVSG